SFLPLAAWLRKLGWERAATVVDHKGYTFSLELSTIMVAAGALMGIRVGASMLVGAVLCYGVLAPIMHNVPGVTEGTMVINVLGYRGIVQWTVWGGVSLMTTAALLNFFLQWKTLVRAFSGITGVFKKKDPNAEVDPLAAIEVPASWFITGSLIAAAGCIVINYAAFGIAVWLGALAVLLSAI
ncbi:MAG: OPT/YSL family transporter, partial [Myxococcaceae bacterium]